MNHTKIFFLFLALGVTTSILFSSGQVENPDTHLRLTQTRIFVNSGSFKLPLDVGEDSHGNVAINKFGERTMVYNPGQSLIFIPFYLLSKALTDNDGDTYYLTAFFISFINYLLNAISAFFLFKIIVSLGYKEKKALNAALIFCLTSYSFIFAQSTYEHHFEMLFVLIAIYLGISNKIRHHYIYAGLIISIGLIFRSTTILLTPSILFLLNTNKERLLFLVGIIPGTFVLFLYNYYRFQNPFETGYTLAWTNTHGEDFILWSISNIPEAILGFFISPAKGLLFFSPTIILAVLLIKKFYLKNRRFANSILIFILIYVCLFSMNFAWEGSIWSFGPRYILPLIPLFYIPITELKISKRIHLILIVALIAQVLTISVNYKRAVLEQHELNEGIIEDRYVFELKNIPYLVQFKQLWNILPKNYQVSLVNYQPNTPWKKEKRLGSNQEVLNNSIEKNSINFWWIRVFHWNNSIIVRILTLLIMSTTILISLKGYFHVKKNIY